MSTVTTSRKKKLADRLMRIDQAKFLDQVEELLLSLEMQARHDESMEAIKNGDVVTLEEFHKGNLEWLKAKAMK